MRSNLLKHDNVMLRSERRERLEAWAASDSPISHSRWPPAARQGVNESFDCLEHWLLSTRKEPMIVAVELNELSAGDLAGHIAACRKTHGPVVPAVQHQRGQGNPIRRRAAGARRHIGLPATRTDSPAPNSPWPMSRTE